MSVTTVTTAVASEIVTSNEVKANSRIDGTDDDTLIGTLISAARAAAEQATQQAIGSQTRKLLTSSFCDLYLHPPVTSITSITYTDVDGASQTLSSSVYYLDESGLWPVVRLKTGQSWPSLYSQRGVVAVTYVCGYTSATAPQDLKRWVIMAAGAMYENRETDAERPASPLQFAERLLDPYRMPPR